MTIDRQAPIWMQKGAENPLYGNNALFQAALKEFSAHSFKDASLNEILKTAGMNKGSLYYRFRNKMELYLSLLHRIGMEKIAFFQTDDRQDPSSDFFEAFRQKAVLGLRFATQYPLYHALWHRVLAEETSILHAITACFGKMREDYLSQMLLDAHNAGTLRTDVSANAMTVFAAAAMEGLTSLLTPDMGEAEILACVGQVTELLRSGLTGTPS